jgi:F0F1-type ATP synthase delta subunit
MLEKKMNKKVELDIKEDPSLIAGLRVQTSRFVLDNSALARLNAMKEKLKG